MKRKTLNGKEVRNGSLGKNKRSSIPNVCSRFVARKLLWAAITAITAISFHYGLHVSIAQEDLHRPYSSSQQITPSIRTPHFSVTTPYVGSLGAAWRNVTEPSLAEFCKKRNYEFSPWTEEDHLQHHGTLEGKNPKWSKIPALRRSIHKMMSRSSEKQPGWVWLIDADVLVRENSEAKGLDTLESVVSSIPPSKLDSTYLILLRRKAVTSSSILVKASKEGLEFLDKWERWSEHAKREHEKRWVDQGVLNDLLFEKDKTTFREPWKVGVFQVNCLCTDFGIPCNNWWCERLVPDPKPVEDDTPTQTQLHHAAGCEMILGSLDRCLRALEDLKSTTVSKRETEPLRNMQESSTQSKVLKTQNSKNERMKQQMRHYQDISFVPDSSEPIFGICVTRNVEKANMCVEDFFRQTYPPHLLRLVIVATGEPRSFRGNLDTSFSRVILVFRPANTKLGELRNAGLNNVPLDGVFVMWDDDDVRHPDLLKLMYIKLVENDSDAVTIGSQINFDVVRNASIETPARWFGPSFHGLAGNIMGRKTIRTPAYMDLVRGEDSKFLQAMLESNMKVSMLDNSPGTQIRVTHRDNRSNIKQSTRSPLLRVNDNEWQLGGSRNDTFVLSTLHKLLGPKFRPVPEAFRLKDARNTKTSNRLSNSDSFGIFVLTSPARREAMSLQLEPYKEKHKINYVDWVSSSDLQLQGLISDGSLAWGSIPEFRSWYPLSTGQIAVAFGHLNMLKLFHDQDENDFAVFLEDDAVLPKDLSERVAEIVNKAPDGWELINLGRCHSECRNEPSGFTSQFDLCRSGYIAHQRGISNLINNSLPISSLPGDNVWNQLSKHGTVQGYSVSAIVSQNKGKSISKPQSVHSHPECRRTKIKDPKCQSINSDDWKICGVENQMCSCPKGTLVRFGCGDVWTPAAGERVIVSDGKPFLCAVNVFGDPSKYAQKLCQCSTSSTGFSNALRSEDEKVDEEGKSISPERPRTLSATKRPNSLPSAAVVYLVEPDRVFGMPYYGNNIAKPFATNSTSCSREDTSLLHSLTTLENNFFRLHQSYPVILLHEPSFPSALKKAILWHVASLHMRLEFVEVHLNTTMHDNNVERNACAAYFHDNSATRSTNDKSGYLAMCDFMSFSIFDVPQLQKFNYLMRIDTDSCISGSLKVDPFLMAAESNASYVHRSLFREMNSCFLGWEDVVDQYLCSDTHDTVPEARQRIEQWSQRRVACDNGASSRNDTLQNSAKPILPVFDSNWEILHIPSFQSPSVAGFLQSLRATDNVRRSRWGDAPIRTLTALMFFPESNVLTHGDWDYNHKGVPRSVTTSRTGLHSVLKRKSKSKWCVILSATVQPHEDIDMLTQVNPLERQKAYVRSLSAWKKYVDLPVTMVENSSWNISALLQQQNDRVRVFQYPAEKSNGNKGVAERDAIFSLIDNDESSPTFKACDKVVKVTGRFAPMDLEGALMQCPENTELVVQHNLGPEVMRFGAGIESQLFGWKRGNSFEKWYRDWNRPGMIEKRLIEQVRSIGNCSISSVNDDTSSCKNVCFIGPLKLAFPTKRGGFRKIEDYI